jgi:carnitine 3-dehydrogenase
MSSTSAPIKPLAPISRAACIGGGVIGGGWIARFLLAGIDVRVFDPHPEAERIVSEVIANAERAYGLLTEAPLPARARLTFSPNLADAVSGAAWVQESVPERLDLKRRVLAEIDATCPVDALIGSSTSGLLPTELQAGLAHPERLFVAHPYNPVYLLPLVEIVGGKATTAATIERARAVLDAIGMKGVVIARENGEGWGAGKLLAATGGEGLRINPNRNSKVSSVGRLRPQGWRVLWSLSVIQSFFGERMEIGIDCTQ